jgi:hypothetical protein
LEFILLEPCRQFEEGAEEGGAIVIHQLDQARLLHQTAKLNELTCPSTTPEPEEAGCITNLIGTNDPS